MKDDLKYIKIKGTLKSRGEYITNPAEYRPYDAVTIVDNEGDEIYFHSLVISKRLDDTLDYSKEITFYILRFIQKNKMSGVLYAADTGVEKIYYPSLTIDLIKKFLVEAHRDKMGRVGCLSIITIVVVSLVLYNWLELEGSSSLWIGLITGVIFALYKILTSDREEISEMKSILTRDGFSVGSTVNSKY